MEKTKNDSHKRGPYYICI